MSNLSDLVPIPPKNLMNQNLSSASEKTMLKKFGKPGALTYSCSDPDPVFRKQLVFDANVGPFIVNGLQPAVESLRQVLAELKKQAPEVYAAVRTDHLGMLCVRHKRKNRDSYSNHSWGTAIDLKFGSKEVSQGTHKAQRGFLTLYPIFNQFGWYWGAEFSGDYVDSMHFEWSQESILKLDVPKPTPLARHLSGIIEKAMAGHPDLETALALLSALDDESLGYAPEAVQDGVDWAVVVVPPRHPLTLGQSADVNNVPAGDLLSTLSYFKIGQTQQSTTAGSSPTSATQFTIRTGVATGTAATELASPAATPAAVNALTVNAAGGIGEKMNVILFSQ
jgi:hypothetical protein